MKKGLIMAGLLLFCIALYTANAPGATRVARHAHSMPLSFTKNMGQWDDRVFFRANAGGATMWFTKEGVTYQFTRRIANPVGAALAAARDSGQNEVTAGDRKGRPYNPGDRFSDEPDSIEQLIFTAKFVGANPNPEIIAEGQLEYKCNYFLGNDPAKWYTDVPNYEAIMLKDIYPGISLKYSGGDNGQAAYEFIAAPGADIAQIKVAYEGAEETSLDSDGRLILKTKWGDMVAAIDPVTSTTGLASLRFVGNSERAPSIAGGGQNLAQANSGTLTVAYSTLFRLSYGDAIFDVAADGFGSIYMTGWTHTLDFPTQNPYDSTHDGRWDAFVMKFSAAGDSLVYSTLLGGASSDYGNGIAVDGSGCTYVTGETASSDFPTQNAYDASFNGGTYGDAFVTKFSAEGNSLVYSTFLGGGSGGDIGRDIAVDGSGCAYVTGATRSSDFPTLNAYDASYYYYNYWDAFVTKFSAAGNALVYSTYLGGVDQDEGSCVVVDGSGCAYVAGNTCNSDFPTHKAYDASFNGGYHDVFVTKFSAEGSALLYSTFLGGSDQDFADYITVDGSGCAFVTGETSSSDFPTQNPYAASFGGGYQDVFVTKLSAAGDSLVYSTYLGGSNDEFPGGIAIDSSGCAYVAGNTLSSDFPTQNAYDASYGGGWCDMFVTKCSAAGNSLVYSTFLGGSGDDGSLIPAVDSSGCAYVVGGTRSPDFPTQNTHDASIGDYYNYFLIKLTWTPEYSCGDVNSDLDVSLLDVIYLIDNLFLGGPTPEPLEAGDIDCSRGITLRDVVLLIKYLFRNGPAPCDGCK